MILIENMEMPESCKGCPLQYDATEGGAEYCCLLDEYVGSRKTERLPDCPLREVTERKKDEYVAELEETIKILKNRNASPKGMINVAVAGDHLPKYVKGVE